MRLVRILRSAARLMIAATLYYSGILGFQLRRRYAGQAVVLLYHRVLPESESVRSCSSDSIMVTPATFRRQLQALRRHFTFVSPPEFEDWWQGKRRFAKPPCLISFDDGWKDNLVHAFPILRAERVPAVIFLPTDYVGTGRVFWQERLTGLLEMLGRHPELRAHPLVAELNIESVFAGSAPMRARQARDVARRFKSHTPEQIEDAVAKVTALVRSAVGTPEPVTVDTYLDWQEVLAMQSEGIYFGSHAVTHRILTRLDETTVHHELTTSKRTLEQKLGQPVRFLAYPNGDHDSTTCRITREAGYALAFTTVPGWVKPGQDPHRLRRINIHERAHRHTATFYAAILGVV